MYEVKHAISEKAWERFLEMEWQALEERRRGALALALGGPLPGESPEELQWVAIEDRHIAEERLVELRSGEEVFYQHIDDLTTEDLLGRIEAESTRRPSLWNGRERKLKASGSGGWGGAQTIACSTS
jgi:hypothetical protein